MPSLVYRSAAASLVVQVLVVAVTGATFFLPSSKKDLNTIVLFEFASQIVEMIWYGMAVCRFKSILTWTRYLDWVLSTPIMLITTAFFFHHRQGLPIFDVFDSYRIYACLALNWVMLAFGLAMETDTLGNRPVGLGLGGLAFVGSFTLLSLFMDGADHVSVGLFYVMYAVWGLYGVAAAFPDEPKNVSYNILDLVSKNFYGVFLFAYTLST